MGQFVQILRCDFRSSDGEVNRWTNFFKFDARCSEARLFEKNFVGAHHDSKVVNDTEADDMLDTLQSDGINLKTITKDDKRFRMAGQITHVLDVEEVDQQAFDSSQFF